MIHLEFFLGHCGRCYRGFHLEFFAFWGSSLPVVGSIIVLEASKASSLLTKRTDKQQQNKYLFWTKERNLT